MHPVRLAPWALPAASCAVRSPVRSQLPLVAVPNLGEEDDDLLASQGAGLGPQALDRARAPFVAFGLHVLSMYRRRRLGEVHHDLTLRLLSAAPKVARACTRRGMCARAWKPVMDSYPQGHRHEHPLVLPPQGSTAGKSSVKVSPSADRRRR
jgi:hypothetical protein